MMEKQIEKLVANEIDLIDPGHRNFGAEIDYLRKQAVELVQTTDDPEKVRAQIKTVHHLGAYSALIGFQNGFFKEVKSNYQRIIDMTEKPENMSKEIGMLAKAAYILADRRQNALLNVF